MEPANNKTYSYHLPGFSEGDENEEITVVNLVRLAIAHMNGENKIKPLPVPEAPILREIFSVDNIHWLGAPTGQHYIVERATNAKGPWKTLAKNISDGKNKFNPLTDTLFADSSKLKKGQRYFYRITAVNGSGKSQPSNIRSIIAN